jgi:hypothetical protein
MFQLARFALLTVVEAIVVNEPPAAATYSSAKDVEVDLTNRK